MRKPMEEVYGAEVLAKTWEGWVDGISHFAKRPEGTKVTLLQIVEPNELQHSYFTHVKNVNTY